MASRKKGKASHYKMLRSGDWVAFKPTLLSLTCCDCGLVHLFEVKFQGGEFGFTIRPDRRATAQIRRHRNITIRKV